MNFSLFQYFIRKKRGGVVAVAVVGQQGNNGLAAFSGRLASSIAAWARRRTDTGENTLPLRQQSSGGKGVVIGNADDFVVNVRVQHLGHKARADALNLVRAASTLGEYRTVGRLDGDDTEAGLAGF